MLSAVLVAGLVVTQPSTGRRGMAVARPLARELSLILALYGLWRIAGQLSLVRLDGALARGRSLWDLERTLHIPSEAALQRAVLPHSWLVQFCNGYYALAHVPSLIALLLWLWIRHRDEYPRIRNVLALGTGACLAIQLLPVAPPRLLPGIGIVDTPALYHQSVYTAVGRGAADQLSAMPSVHVAWAVLIGVAGFRIATGRWRWLPVAHAVITILVVAITGNHFWLDGVGGVAVFALCVLILPNPPETWSDSGDLRTDLAKFRRTLAELDQS